MGCEWGEWGVSGGNGVGGGRRVWSGNGGRGWYWGMG